MKVCIAMCHPESSDCLEIDGVIIKSRSSAEKLARHILAEAKKLWPTTEEIKKNKNEA